MYPLEKSKLITSGLRSLFPTLPLEIHTASPGNTSGKGKWLLQTKHIYNLKENYAKVQIKVVSTLISWFFFQHHLPSSSSTKTKITTHHQGDVIKVNTAKGYRLVRANLRWWVHLLLMVKEKTEIFLGAANCVGTSFFLLIQTQI